LPEKGFGRFRMPRIEICGSRYQETLWKAVMDSLLSILYPLHKEAKSRPNKKNTVLSYILQRILAGEYLPGDHLNEHQISQKIGVSNIPIRQAIERLILLDLVERIPNKGVYLKKMSLKDLQDSYEARLEIETWAVRKIAPHITDKQLGALSQVIREILPSEKPFIRELESAYHPDLHPASAVPIAPENSWEELSHFTLADLLFHLMPIHFTQNRQMENFAELFLTKSFTGYRFRIYLKNRYPEFMNFIEEALRQKVYAKYDPIVSHVQIYHALVRRQGDEAARLLRSHLDAAHEFYKISMALFVEKGPLNKILDEKHIAS
jgi:DNA-binding GntR family transcriptional regulator